MILYTVTVASHSHTCQANSPSHACRKAFKYLIKNKLIKRQPKTTSEGGFENTVVESHANDVVNSDIMTAVQNIKKNHETTNPLPPTPNVFPTTSTTLQTKR